MVSVVMATYNGERYIEDQLNSIISQSFKPREIIIRDDRSSDNTLNIIQSVAKRSNIPICIISGSQNIGYADNFVEAIKSASGRYIFLSDQDDIWFNEKISTVIKAFEKKPYPLVIVNNQRLVDAELSIFPETTIDILSKQGKALEDFVHGCCTAFDSKILPIVLSRPEGLAHDDWIHLIGVVFRSRKVIKEPLQYYRRHNTTVTSSRMNCPILDFGIKNEKRRIIRTKKENIEVATSLKKKLVWHLNLMASFEKCSTYKTAEFSVDQAIKNNNFIIKSIVSRISNIENRSFVGFVKSYISGEYSFFKGNKTFIRDLISIACT